MRLRHMTAVSIAALLLISALPVVSSSSAGDTAGDGLPYVAYTVVLSNGSVVKGNYVPASGLAAIQGEGGIAYDTRNGHLYVTNLFNNITVVNGKTLATIKNISVGGEPFDLIYDNVDGNIYATNLIQHLNVINGKNVELTSNISTGTYSSRMALNSKTNQIYLPDLLNQSYEQISLNKPGGIKNVSIGSAKSTLKHPVQGIAYDVLNNTVFVSNFQTRTMVVLNATTGHIVNNITFDNQIGAMSYNRQQNEVYFALTGDITVVSMNASTYRIMGNMTTGDYPSSIAFDNNAGYIFVTDEGNSTLSIYNMTSFGEVETLNLSLGPTGALFSSAQSRLYVVNSGSGTLSVINVNSTRSGQIPEYRIVLVVAGISAIITSTAIWRRLRKP